MNNAVALYVPANTDIATVTPFQVGESYEMLQNAVGGWFELVCFPNGVDMWVNEDGIALGLPMNALATAAHWKAFPNAIGRSFIYGNVIFTGCTDDEGDTLGLDLDGFDFLGILCDEFGIKLDLQLMTS